jgi:leucyl-tRNA synthetase
METTIKQTYDPAAIERHWQEAWELSRAFRAPNPGDPGFDAAQPKYYILDMFPYPSGAGLHVGHPLGYIGSDVVARRKRMEGFNVLHPMGFDAFGLPAEQYAIQTGKHPARTTAENVENYRRQLRLIGLSYDWEREFSTCDPAYYRWTQWIFGRLFDAGLAYQAEVPVWWCEELKTVLANEEVINGRSERGDHPCVRRPLKQWMLRITAYAERLLEDLEALDWPESVKTMQREWIGRSDGAEVSFPVEGEDPISVFTTRPDTLYGATFMVLAPEHPLVERITTEGQRADVEAYLAAASLKSELERTDLAKEKTGVFTGAFAVNPVRASDDPESRVPIWVADYVMMGYGTGAIMAVPGHDERDFEFAQTFDLPVVEVVRPPQGTKGLADGECFSGDGTAINSPDWDGLPTAEAKTRSIEILRERGLGDAQTTWRLRDWIFSRQRYWGEPFPVLHLEDGTIVRVRDEDLPVLLPEMDDFTPAEDGSAPLARATDWVETVDPASGAAARRDTDTMPGWAGSCWYHLRFMDPSNDSALFSPEAAAYWGQVDLYLGGVEHAVLHLLYSRFWHKVLQDAGVVDWGEPFGRLFNQGMMTAFAYKDSKGRLVPSDEVEERDGEYVMAASGDGVQQVVAKMSKSLKNVVNPDDVCSEYGTDTFRLYELFMGPLADSKPWNPRDVPGCRRFLDRVWRLFVEPEGSDPVRAHLLVPAGPPVGQGAELERALHAALQRVNDSFKAFNFNTAIAALMSFVNEATPRVLVLDRSQAERFLCALAPFAPHICEELWDRLGHDAGLTRAPWPEADPAWLARDEFELIVQVLGKVRGRAMAPCDASQDELEELARAAVGEQLADKQVMRVIVVPGKLVNFVVR